MVRFLRSTISDFETREELQRFLIIERLLAVLHIPASICLALGSLAEVDVVPYASEWQPWLMLAASLFLVISNSREANECIRTVFLPARQKAIYSDREKAEPIVGGQMHMFAAVMMALGSLSLFNSCLIALSAPQEKENVLSKRQHAMAFCFFLVGSAGNNLAIEKAPRVTQFTRGMLTFQNVLCSASFGISALLMLPCFKLVQGAVFHQNALTASTALGSFFAVLSAMMHYFHTIALAWAHIEVFERKNYEEEVREQALVSREQEPKPGYIRRFRDAFTSGKSIFGRQGNQQSPAVDKREKGPLGHVDVSSSDLDDDILGHDDYDGSSLSLTGSLSESSRWSGSEQHPIQSSERVEPAN
ncbi:unnamed protein product [Chondrus crispus]|uniref:Transmembrane protein n=1 Tax=Chondrus crispus TaxID=2769 RepID=R7QNS1_CHOCR|nr:unnamed protein product [Chondrus crispus]CDF39126.1 unnamed protein product [Chondrus crispus]|eukprot:XP_005719037.1 unnamed protein product [Chondrus crispus]